MHIDFELTAAHMLLPSGGACLWVRQHSGLYMTQASEIVCVVEHSVVLEQSQKLNRPVGSVACLLWCAKHRLLKCHCRYNRLVAQNATSLTRRFTRLHGLQPLLLTELSAMDTARKACLTQLGQLAPRCGSVTQSFVDQVRAF